MIAVLPPSNMAPEALFWRLLERPRATLPIAYRISGAEDVPLRVRALSGQDIAAATLAGDAPGELGIGRSWSEIVCRALLTPDGPAFGSADELGALRQEELPQLAAAVRAALDVISPTYSVSNVGAWIRTLEQGAKAPMNFAAVQALGVSVDLSLGYGSMATAPRPDRYFGIPLADMTDGQWMVYRAARAIFEQLTNRKS